VGAGACNGAVCAGAVWGGATWVGGPNGTCQGVGPPGCSLAGTGCGVGGTWGEPATGSVLGQVDIPGSGASGRSFISWVPSSITGDLFSMFYSASDCRDLTAVQYTRSGLRVALQNLRTS
jgi:hypothetical protein